MGVFAVSLHKTYEFVSFVRDKMKQTELGEVIRTRCQGKAKKGEEWEEEAHVLTSHYRFRAPPGGVCWHCMVNVWKAAFVRRLRLILVVHV